MSSSEITMVIPAESRFISTARVTAASLAAELDYSVDAIEQLRMGANELIVLLTELAEDNAVPSVTVHFVVDDDSIEMRGRVDTDVSLDSEVDELARRILDASVDEYGFEGNSGRILKRRDR